MKQHIDYLASDALQGRLTGTAGRAAGDANMPPALFKAFGLLPAGR